MCDWSGCPRRGKNQTSRFALLSHLRSHTGEKPFNCPRAGPSSLALHRRRTQLTPRAECDKSFTRTDALQKHMRIQHGETILPSRRPPSKKRKTARANSMDSVLDGKGEDDDGTVAGDDEEDKEIAWTEEKLNVFEQHPTLSRHFVAYVVEKAKWAYLLGEHEGLLGELEALGTREAELGAECEELLKRVLRKEVGCVVVFVGVVRVELTACDVQRGSRGRDEWRAARNILDDVRSQAAADTGGVDGRGERKVARAGISGVCCRYLTFAESRSGAGLCRERLFALRLRTAQHERNSSVTSAERREATTSKAALEDDLRLCKTDVSTDFPLIHPLQLCTVPLHHVHKQVGRLADVVEELLSGHARVAGDGELEAFGVCKRR